MRVSCVVFAVCFPKACRVEECVCILAVPRQLRVKRSFVERLALLDEEMKKDEVKIESLVKDLLSLEENRDFG